MAKTRADGAYFYKQLCQLLNCINHFRTESTIKKAMEKLKIKEYRTIKRYISLMENLDIDIAEISDNDSLESEKAKRGYNTRYVIVEESIKELDSKFRIPDQELSIDEIAALYLIRGEGKIFRGTKIEDALDAAFAKLGIVIPDDILNKMGQIRSMFISSTKFAKDYAEKEAIIETFREAIFGRNICDVTYHSKSHQETWETSIGPIRFLENEGGLYLFAQDMKNGSYRPFAIERFQEVAITEHPYQYPKNDKILEEKLALAFNLNWDEDQVTFKIRISEQQAQYVEERNFVKPHMIHQNADGSIILELTTSGRWDVKRWVMQWGSEAELLEPADLREEIGNELRGLAERYSS